MKNKRFTDVKADILMMFCQLIMQPLLNRFHYYTLKELETKETTKTALSD